MPPDKTRPTSDRVRESLFSSLLSELGTFDGLAVLDLYAGSGALGLEAVSRGAAQAVLVDSARGAYEACMANIQMTGLSAEAVRSDVAQWLSRAGGQFDLVFLDPPYAQPVTQTEGVVEALVHAKILSVGAIVVVEASSKSADLAWPTGFQQPVVKSVGDTKMSRSGWYGHDIAPSTG